MTPGAVGRFCLFLSVFLIPLHAQQPQLRIVVIEGEGALNNIAGRAARDVVVEVQGANARPAAGAQVTFNLPLTGASGTFGNGERTFMVTADEQGRAAATGLRPNNITGPLQIRVAATYQDQTATAVISQTNVAVAVTEEPKPPTTPSAGSTTQPAPRRGLSTTAKVLLILAIAGGAAAGAGVALSSGGSNGGGGGGGGTPPIVITPGTPSVGGPQ